MLAKGTFETIATVEPPYEDVGGVSASRSHFEKRFRGALEATSKVQMLSVRTPVMGSGAFVALERVQGLLEGRLGSFMLAHYSVMGHGQRTHTMHIVPDSGTGELRRITGSMEIHVAEGVRMYTLDFALPDEEPISKLDRV
jgi:hypothetical protein